MTGSSSTTQPQSSTSCRSQVHNVPLMAVLAIMSWHVHRSHTCPGHAAACRGMACHKTTKGRCRQRHKEQGCSCHSGPPLMSTPASTVPAIAQPPSLPTRHIRPASKRTHQGHTAACYHSISAHTMGDRLEKPFHPFTRSHCSMLTAHTMGHKLINSKSLSVPKGGGTARTCRTQDSVAGVTPAPTAPAAAAPPSLLT
jgi:hypothetical protein